MKKKMLEIIILALWFFFSYLAIILGISKNGLYIVVGFPILFVGGLLIVHPFQNKNENGK
ncbi:hypothetical protein COF62_14560 [Bacillus toyonensis]|uniref:Uncharacterized protein n=1 Tax=Bacillus toyonensis TaxID=155322 RepID=A0AAP8F2Y2_9BACI|nr:hypothetical protein CON81_26590 [Bacillus toyonensis]PHE12721.1 hypothetical protein COF62_14560 [Bacillus toyonensis]